MDSLSRSIATRSRSLSKRYLVSTPVPGPISITSLYPSKLRVSAICLAIPSSLRKCCPKCFFAFTGLSPIHGFWSSVPSLLIFFFFFLDIGPVFLVCMLSGYLGAIGGTKHNIFNHFGFNPYGSFYFPFILGFRIFSLEFDTSYARIEVVQCSLIISNSVLKETNLPAKRSIALFLSASASSL